VQIEGGAADGLSCASTWSGWTQSGHLFCPFRLNPYNSYHITCRAVPRFEFQSRRIVFVPRTRDPMNKTSTWVRVGCGSAYSEDRIDLAMEMTAQGRIQYLCMDGLSERTLALAHQRRDARTGEGAFDVRLPELASEVLPLAVAHGVKIISNMGAANPRGAAMYIREHAKSRSLRGVKVAAIEGDDVAAYVAENDPIIIETGEPVSKLGGHVIAANAYLGAEPILDALRQGATVIIGGRIADPSLYVAPIAYELGWALDDWNLMGAATVAGHLLECGDLVTGGNFADPPYRVVERFDHPSFPLAEVRADGSLVISKLADTDGLLSVDTCKAQLGYEIGDPANYITPDVTADFRQVTLKPVPEGVLVAGASGRPRPTQLKALVAVDEGFIGEGQVSFAGPGAVSRGELSRDIIRSWVQPLIDSGKLSELKIDLLGVDSVHGPASPRRGEPYEVHVRVAGRCVDRDSAEKVADAGWQIQLFGPAAAGGHRKSVKRVAAMYSFFLPRDSVRTTVRMLDD